MLTKKLLCDGTILKILKNEIYKGGDFVQGKRTSNPTYYENVVEPIISKEVWKMPSIKEKN